jgi:hypothetical protein
LWCRKIVGLFIQTSSQKSVIGGTELDRTGSGIMVEWLALLLCVLEILGLILSMEVGYSED